MKDLTIQAFALAADIAEGRMDSALEAIANLPALEAAALTGLIMHECQKRGKAAAEQGRAFANMLYVRAFCEAA